MKISSICRHGSGLALAPEVKGLWIHLQGRTHDAQLSRVSDYA